jgi:hypothetical protein
VFCWKAPRSMAGLLEDSLVSLTGRISLLKISTPVSSNALLQCFQNQRPLLAHAQVGCDITANVIAFPTSVHLSLADAQAIKVCPTHVIYVSSFQPDIPHRKSLPIAPAFRNLLLKGTILSHSSVSILWLPKESCGRNTGRSQRPHFPT